MAAHTPRHVLELAAGTGVLTRELLAVAGSVTATDLNAATVELGGREVPGARWRQADATRLPFAEGEFDLVACQFGVMFFPDKPAAFAGTRRVLTPGGRLAMNTWGELRADPAATTEAVAREMTALLGEGPVAGSMTALVIEATPV